MYIVQHNHRTDCVQLKISKLEGERGRELTSDTKTREGGSQLAISKLGEGVSLKMKCKLHVEFML